MEVIIATLGGFKYDQPTMYTFILNEKEGVIDITDGESSWKTNFGFVWIRHVEDNYIVTDVGIQFGQHDGVDGTVWGVIEPYWIKDIAPEEAANLHNLEEKLYALKLAGRK